MPGGPSTRVLCFLSLLTCFCSLWRAAEAFNSLQPGCVLDIQFTVEDQDCDEDVCWTALTIRVTNEYPNCTNDGVYVPIVATRPFHLARGVGYDIFRFFMEGSIGTVVIEGPVPLDVDYMTWVRDYGCSDLACDGPVPPLNNPGATTYGATTLSSGSTTFGSGSGSGGDTGAGDGGSGAAGGEDSGVGSGGNSGSGSTTGAGSGSAPAAVRVGFNGDVFGCTVEEIVTSPFLLSPTYITSYPRPSVTISFDPATQTFLFSARASYSPQYTRYVVGFAPFEGEWTAVDPWAPLRTPSGGSNVYGRFYSISPFSAWWAHAGNALQADVYAQQYADPTSRWNFTADGCAALLFRASFAVQELSTLRSNSQTNYRLMTYTTSGGTTTASGTLYVTMVSPTSLADGESAGYSYAQWPFPFNVHIDTDTVSVVVSPNGAVVQVLFTTATVTPDGRLKIVLQTLEQTRGGQYTYGLMAFLSASGPVPLDLQLVSTLTPQAAPARQTFTYLSETVPADGVYTGLYTFELTAFECTGQSFPAACPKSGPVSIATWVDVTIPPSLDYSYAYNTSTTLYTSPSFTELLPDAPLLDGTQVCALDFVTNAGDDLGGFVSSLVIEDVYICGAETPGGIVAYDGVANFGCLSASNYAVLVRDGMVVDGAVDFYAPLLAFVSSVSSGVCFLARTQVLDTDAMRLTTPASAQYVHVRATVLLNTFSSGPMKRSIVVQSVVNVSTVGSLSDFVVVAGPAPSNAPTARPPTVPPGDLIPAAPAPAQQGSSTAGIVIGVGTVVGAAVVALIACFALKKKRRRRRCEKPCPDREDEKPLLESFRRPEKQFLQV